MRTRIPLSRYLVGMLLVLLGACSSKDEASAPAPAPAVQAPAAAAAPATPAEIPVALTFEQAASLKRPHSPVLGAANARVTVVEVLDPACEACRAFAPVVKQLLFLYPEDVRVVVRFANFHPPSEEAIRLLVAAQGQGKFDALLGALFERQEEWASHTAPDPARVWQIAGEVGINVAKARTDARSALVDALLRTEASDLSVLKVELTPTFFVNGKPLPSFGPDELLDFVRSEVGR